MFCNNFSALNRGGPRFNAVSVILKLANRKTNANHGTQKSRLSVRVEGFAMVIKAKRADKIGDFKTR